MTRETVAELVNPEDPQDVPRAVALMQAPITLSKLPSVELHPKEQKDSRALALLGVMLSSLLEPFIKIEMSLQKQLTSLSAYAFLSFATFKLHVTSFSSNQLYADCQSMIKNAYFCVRKQQCMDPKARFFLLQLGDDRLELHFCEVRCSSHQCNVDISELSQKTSAAMDHHEIFERHPDWDRGHRRLKFIDSIAVDHVNPSSWKGANVCGEVSLELAWLAGKAEAEAALTAAQFPFNFDEFTQDGDAPLDMLRPDGDGVYPAVATEKDRSLEEPIVSTEPRAAASNINETVTMQGGNTREIQESDHETLPPVELVGDYPRDKESDGQDESHEPNLDRTWGDNVINSDDSDSEDEDGIDLDDILAEIEQAEDEDEGGEDWITCADGYKWHKASLIRKKIHVDRNHMGKKSKNRKERVRVFTQFKQADDFGHDDPLGDSIFTCNSPAILLVHSGNVLCLAVMSVHSMEKKKKKRVMAIDIDEMALPSSGIKVTGQILELRQLDSASWIWSGTYLSLPPVKPRTGVAAAKAKAGKTAAKKQMLITVTSDLIHPIDPAIIATNTIPDWDVTAAETTWKFNSDGLQALAASLLESARAANSEDAPGATSSSAGSALGLFPQCGTTELLPYHYGIESE